MNGKFKGEPGRGSHLSLVVAPSRIARAKPWVALIVPDLLIIAFCYVILLFVFNGVQSFGNGLTGIGKGLEGLDQSLVIGGTAADVAQNAAASHLSVPLNVSELNAAFPRYKWIDGATPVPSSSLKRPIVGVNVVGTDIETMVQRGPSLCSYGLSVNSRSDPLISQDHLPGPGTYYRFQSNPCVANQLPTSSWMTYLGIP